MSDAATPLLILGLGNVLLADDGAGVAAVSWIVEHYWPPAGVLILDGGTLGLSLLPHLQAAERAILVDAVTANAPPGCLVRLDGEAVGHACRVRLSPHQVGVADLLDTAKLTGRVPPELVLWGIVPERIELDAELSPSVRASVPELALAVVEEAHKLGFVFGEREVAE